MAMSPVEYHLKLAIQRWCGATPDQYVPDSLFRDIWAGKIPQIPYEPEGIRRLFVSLSEDPFFANCPAAQNLRPGEFLKGGDLQTVRQLYVRLLDCGMTSVTFNEEGQFDAAIPVSDTDASQRSVKRTKAKRSGN
jgi:hypothetical protein